MRTSLNVRTCYAYDNMYGQVREADECHFVMQGINID